MKTFFLTCLIAIFTFNYAAMAYASPCAFSMKMEQTNAQSQQDMADMPDCHKNMQKQTQENKKECKGICLCKHVHVNSFAVLPEYTQSHDRPMMKNEVFMAMRHHHPFIPAIIDRPPISLS